MPLTNGEIEAAKKALDEADIPISDRYIFYPGECVMYYIDTDGNLSIIEEDDNESISKEVF